MSLPYYKKVADADDPADSVEVAFGKLSALTEITPNPLRIDDVRLAGAIGTVKAATFEAKLNAAIANGDLNAKIMTWFLGKGIDVSNPEVSVILNGLVTKGYFLQAEVDEVIALGAVVRHCFAHLKPGEIQHARDLRNQGVI